jgi:glycosyltransferase involved in cell wall biosynthesis
MERPIISTVLLNWNREHLLRVTVDSYLATVTVPYELIIVDNASTDGSRAFIEQVCQRDRRHRAVFRKRNDGGRALNGGLRLARGAFLHTTENDLEYLSGWDTELLRKFEAFPELGQLSVFGPEPDAASGEIWEKHESERIARGDAVIYVARAVGTSSVWRRELWDGGVRWGTILSLGGARSRSKLPADFSASLVIGERGYWVAWNDRYTVINWGHNVQEWQANPDYYLDNYRAKWWLGSDALRKRLREHGYDLVAEGADVKIIPVSSAERSGDG